MTRAKKIYAKLGRIAYGTLTPFLRFYMNGNHMRVRVLLTNTQGEILLVRSWMGHQRWTLPGGGIQNHEAPLGAAARELYEETGIKLLTSQLKELGSFTNPYKTAPFGITCFMAEVEKIEIRQSPLRKLEILDIKWFRLKELPEDYSPTIDLALGLKRQV